MATHAMGLTSSSKTSVKLMEKGPVGPTWKFTNPHSGFCISLFRAIDEHPETLR